jgi:glycosyltransferase involved in cell wall biosynthesis
VRMLPFAWRRPPAPAGDAPGAYRSVAIVLQATGSHAWAVSRGWARAAGKLGVLGAVIAPRARWGERRVRDDGGLAAYLRTAGRSDLIVLLGFDWHSQALHRSWLWRRRLARTRASKVVYAHESIAAWERRRGSDAMRRALRSAAALCDGVLYADLADRPVVEAAGKPSRWLPFGVDPDVFRVATPLLERAPRAFFRGKVDGFGSPSEYAERRHLLAQLQARGLVEVVPYTEGPVDAEVLVADFNRFRVALNPPSVFAGHPTRVLEAMACGCCVVTSRTGLPAVDGLFEDGVELAYCGGGEEFTAAVRRLGRDSAAAQAMAERGRRAALERFSLDRQLSEVIDWARRTLPGALPPDGRQR